MRLFLATVAHAHAHALTHRSARARAHSHTQASTRARARTRTRTHARTRVHAGATGWMNSVDPLYAKIADAWMEQVAIRESASASGAL
jgi:hypothetical protein